MRIFLQSVAAAALLAALAESASAQLVRRSEYRALNTVFHEIDFQRNGLIDVSLADESKVVDDAFPMIWFADEEEPERLKTDAVYTQRFGVRDALGDGNGMLMRMPETEWTFRVYQTQPFFAVQVQYTNTGKKPVRVKALMPWCVGEPKKGVVDLGPGTPEAAMLQDALGDTPRLVRGSTDTPDVLGIYNPMSRRTLVAGFLTEGRASNRIVVRSDEDDPVFDRFRAISTFDPPVTVEPGASLASEALYLSFAEPEPYVAMRRYARAVTAADPRYEAAETERAEPERWATPLLGEERGVTSMVANIAQQAFAVPYLMRHALKVPLQELSETEVLTLASAASLLGASIEWDNQDTFAPELMARLDAATRPAAETPARPLDFFLEERPSILHLPPTHDGEEAHVLAVFNWSGQRDESVTIPLQALGLNANAYYTVYDFWADRYLGTAQGALTFAIDPAGVTVVVLRPYLRQPMVLRLGSNLAQSDPAAIKTDWRPATYTYAVRMTGTPEETLEFPMLIPDGYVYRETVNATAHRDADNPRVLRVTVTLDRNGSAEFASTFEPIS